MDAPACQPKPKRQPCLSSPIDACRPNGWNVSFQHSSVSVFTPTALTMTPHAMPVTLRNPGRFSVGRDHILNVIEVILDPLILVLSQWAVAVAIEGRLTP